MNPLTLSKPILCAITAIATATSTIGAEPTPPVKSVATLKKEAQAHIKNISPAHLKKALDAKEKLFLIDIRTEAEYLAGHLDGSLWIPRGKLEFLIQKTTKNPNAKIVLYCRSGSRSSLATNTLQNMGYQNVFNLDGGFAGWADQQFSIYNRHGELKVVDFENENKK